MSKVEVSCPFCKRFNVVDRANYVGAVMPQIKCDHCRKTWLEDLQLAKAAPVDEISDAEIEQLKKELRAKLDVLEDRVRELLKQYSKPRKFQPQGVDNSDVARRELNKALANPKPAEFGSESVRKSGFQPIQSVAPGVRMPVNDLPVGPAVKRGGKFQPQQS